MSNAPASASGPTDDTRSPDAPGSDADPSLKVWSPQFLTTTIGGFSMIMLVAFESLAINTVMPTVARALDGEELFATAFAAALASSVVGMVAAGLWSDRRGPGGPLLTAFAVFASGLAICAVAPSMEVLVAGRILQGIGGGAATVVLYVIVGLFYPARLQPQLFALFSMAWVLPSLFGPYLAAVIADQVGWRWVFGGVVFLVAGALVLLVPVVLRTRTSVPEGDTTGTYTNLLWAVLAAASVLGVELLADWPVAALACILVTLGALSRLFPAGAMLLRRGLPSVIATRFFMAASFFSAEAYIVYTLEDKWGLSAATAGLALTGVGVVWALGSQAQAKAKDLSHTRTMVAGTSVILAGLVAVAACLWLEPAWWITMIFYVIAGAGMGFAYARTSVSMLGFSTETDRGFNSSALTIAESLGAALALTVAGLTFATAQRSDVDPFATIYTVAAGLAVVAVIAATRTDAHARPSDS